MFTFTGPQGSLDVSVKRSQAANILHDPGTFRAIKFVRAASGF